MHNVNQFKGLLTTTSSGAPPRRLNRWGWGWGLDACVLAGSCAAFKPLVGVVTKAEGAEGRAQAHATNRRTKMAVERMVKIRGICENRPLRWEALVYNVFWGGPF